MPIWERIAWWAMARAVRRYRSLDPVGGVLYPRQSVAKMLHLRLDGVFFNDWPEDWGDD
jgi:hypothetical protein